MKKKSKFPEKAYLTLDYDGDESYLLAWKTLPDIPDGEGYFTVAEYKLVRVGKIKNVEPTVEWQ